MAFYKTYKFPIIITRCSNNYGPYQFPEKLIPLMIVNSIQEKDMPVYGKGNQIRDWIYVEDHVDAICEILKSGKIGEIYNIGQTEEISIKDLAQLVIDTTNSNSEVKFKSHKDVFGDKFEDPTRRTPNIDKIIKATGIKPSYDIKTMIKEIVEFKRQD